MAPRKTKVIPYTTETFAKFITDSIASNSNLPELGELVVVKWQLAEFDIPRDAVRKLCDVLFEQDLPINCLLNTVLVSTY